MRRKSFTILEVIVGTLLLAIAFGGVFTAFVAARAYVTRANERVVAANLARRALEDLYDHVSADTWNTGALRSPQTDTPEPDYTIDANAYDNNTYDVSAVGTHDYRQVDMSVDYTAATGGGVIH